jgi:hypothetical protein
MHYVSDAYADVKTVVDHVDSTGSQLSKDQINVLLLRSCDLRNAQDQLAAIRHLVATQLDGKSGHQLLQDNCQTLSLIGDIADGQYPVQSLLADAGVPSQI